jgi:cholesterol oxidase
MAVQGESIMAEGREEIPALIIGSGFGGSIAALRLGERGIRTVVLERGRSWSCSAEQDTFCTYREPDQRAAWFSDETVLFAPKPIQRFAGILERLVEDGITVWCAAGIGGGSLVYNGCHYQPLREIFERVFPAEISYDEMDKVYYPRVRSVIEPAQIPGDVLASDYYLSSRAFTEQAAFAGLKTKRLDIAIDWDIVRQEITGEKRPAAIGGEIWYGVNSGAKRSLDTNYLAKAIGTGNVEVKPLHVVTDIAESDDDGFTVDCTEINETGETVTHRQYGTKRLFLAAGTMGTCKLLVRAKGKGALSRLNEHVGRDWGNNGDTFATRYISTRSNPGQGGTASIVIEHANNPILPTSLIVYPEWDAPEGTLTTLGMTLPTDLGDFTYDRERDQAQLHWRPDTTDNMKMLDAVNLTYALLNADNPYDLPPEGSLSFSGHYHCPVNGFPDQSHLNAGQHETTKANAGITAHPIGGAVLGKACDWYGRLKGYQGLYVVDGAMVPGGCTAATNPAHTIAALAERCMDRILVEDFTGS